MKKNFLLTVIGVFTLLFTNALDCKAYDNEMRISTKVTAHWASFLPDSTRLCDLSIPCSHDAATHDSSILLWEDQEWNEWSLFQMGVRAFDLRLCSSGYYLHGGILQNKYEEEQKNEMPTPYQLEKEFMILFIQWEREQTDDIKIKGLQLWLDKVMENSEKPYTKDMFVRYHKGMTLGDVRGRILVISNEHKVFSEAAIENEAHRIPIAWHSDNYICDSKEGDPDSVSMSVKDPYLRQGDYEADRENKKKDVKKCFDNWFKMYENDNGNQSGTIHVNMINSYYHDGILVDPGASICRDTWGTEGVNHYAYDYLRDKQDPYGIVWCDFLGYDGGYFGNHYYGNYILERIVLNNFNLLRSGKYVSDLAVCNIEDEASKAQFDEWEKQGGVFLDEQKYIDNPFANGIIGYKTSNDVSQAITNILVYKSSSMTTPDTIIGPCNHKYVKASVNTAKYKGPLLCQDGDDYLSLYYTTEQGTDSITNQAITGLEYVTTASDSCAYIWDPKDNSYKDPAELTRPYVFGYGSKYLKLYTHKHSFHLNHDSINHYEECVPCGMRKNIEEHKITFKKSELFSHIDTCTACGYRLTKICKAKKYDEDGFGTCDTCQNICVEIPELDKNKRYSISNPGHLYWFAAHANNDGHNYGCDLSNDIVISDEVQNKMAWIPIGTSEKAAKKYLKKNGELKIADENGYRFGSGYLGTFNGNGHTISINYDGGTKYPACGLFGYLNHATVKNLGIVNSSFTGYDYVGSLAGKIDSTTVENVYSTANIENTSNSIYQGGIAGYVEGTTKISNGYYYGNAGSAFGEIAGKKTKVKNFFANNEEDATATYATDEQFGSGEICYKLNNSKYATDILWRQNLGDYNEAEALPCFDSSHDIVVPAKYNNRKFVGLGYNSSYYKINRLKLRDGYDFSFPVEVSCPEIKCSTKRYVEGHWGTVCLPYRIANNDSYKLYTISDAQQNDQSVTIHLTPIKKYLEAYTPAVFYTKTVGDSLDFVGTEEKVAYDDQLFLLDKACITPQKDNSCITADSLNANTHLHGTFEERTIANDGSLWALNVVNDKLCSLDGENTATIMPFRAWITFKQQSDKTPTSFVFDGGDSGDATAISNDDLVIDANEFDFPMYDTSGRRIKVPQNGQIIIKNGKKLIYKK